MAKIKYDAVIQAVHYKPGGEVVWVRTFQRRGPIFSDCVILNREELIKDIMDGKKYMVGRRVPYMAGTFEVSTPVNVIQDNGKAILVTGDTHADRDHLAEIPVI